MKKIILGLLLLPAPLALPAAETLIKVAAKVGSEIITDYEIAQMGRMVEASMSPAERASDEGKKKLAEVKKRALDRLIEQKLIVLAAKDGPPGFKEAQTQGKASNNPYLPGSVEVEEEMEKAFDEVRKRFGGDDAFEAAMAKERLTLPELRNKMREQKRDEMTAGRMVKMKEREFQPSLRVTDEEAKAFYDENKSRFATGEQLDLRHILLKSADEALARQIMAKVRAARDMKAEFISQCKRHSIDDLTREQGGRLGWVERGQSEPEVEKAAFEAKAGGLAGPAESAAGLHLLLIEGHKDAEQKGFDAVKENCRNLIYQQKIQKRLEEWVEELKRSYYVERIEG